MSNDPQVPPSPAPAPAPEQPPEPGVMSKVLGWVKRHKVWSTVIAVVVIFIMIGALAPDSSQDSASPDVPDVSPTQGESPAKSSTKAVVPHVTGVSLTQARERLRAHGLHIGSLSKRPSKKPKGTVLAQSHRSGATLKDGSSVALVIAAPLPIVPNTVGDARFAAQRELRMAGFNIRTTKRQTNSASPGTVIDQAPNGAARARPGATVTITIAVKPPASSSQGESCTAGYSPCLAPASDYDCAGGSGDGPAYADGPIYVTGSDPYGLDDDGDGVGCE